MKAREINIYFLFLSSMALRDSWHLLNFILHPSAFILEAIIHTSIGDSSLRGGKKDAG